MGRASGPGPGLAERLEGRLNHARRICAAALARRFRLALVLELLLLFVAMLLLCGDYGNALHACMVSCGPRGVLIAGAKPGCTPNRP